jgi:hypothetical protein
MECRPLQRRCARPVGRPPKRPVLRYHDFMYRAGVETASVVLWAPGKREGSRVHERDEPLRDGDPDEPKRTRNP